jgi:hypothetical protein
MTEPNLTPEEIIEPQAEVQTPEDAPAEVPKVEEATEGDLLYLEERIAFYKAKGQKDDIAEAAAKFDLAEIVKKRKYAGEATWNQLVKETKADKLMNDQILRALGIYKTEWEKRNKPFTIDFKLRMESEGEKRNKHAEITSIAGVTLYFHVARNGVWKLWNKKTIKFQHIREMRDGHNWKLQLYEALFFDFVASGVTHRLLQDDYRDGSLKVPVDPNGAAESGGN